MPYIKEVCVAGDTIEINKYYSVRYHSKGEKRDPKVNRTSEAQKRVNQRKASRDLRRLMNTNFKDGDLLVRLDFHKVETPNGSIDMQALMSKSIRKLRAEFKKRGRPLKYIYVKEIGPRGGRHIHLMISKCSTDVLMKCWPYGGIHVDPLISKGQYSKVAEYFIKYAAKTEETEGQLIGKRWYASRNLEKPKISKHIISANTFRKEARCKKGYEVDKDSVREGISGFTGYEYFSYTLIKQQRIDKEGAGG